MMLIESFRSAVFKRKTIRSEFNEMKHSKFMARLPWKMRFGRSKLYISALVPGSIGFAGGLLASILGIGGGFLFVPAMIYILGMPTLLVAGTSLFQMAFTTGFATIMHAVASNTVDAFLALILIIGGVIGAQVGVTFSKVVRGAPARIVLAVIIMVVCFQMIGHLFLEPLDLFSTSIR